MFEKAGVIVYVRGAGSHISDPAAVTIVPDVCDSSVVNEDLSLTPLIAARLVW